MPEQPPKRIADLPHRIREQIVESKANYRQWRSAIQDDPALLWRNPASRILLWILLAVAAYFVVSGVARAIVPDSGKQADDDSRNATLYVACTNPACTKSYTTVQPRDFAAWPLACRHCQQPTVQRARPCPRCRVWAASTTIDTNGCPTCRTAQDAARKKPTPRSKPANADDAEDPWDTP